MNYTVLIISFREGCRDGLFDAGKVASADNHNILHSTVLKLIKSALLELGALIFAYGKRQDFLTPAAGKSKNYISGFFDNHCVVSD